MKKYILGALILLISAGIYSFVEAKKDNSFNTLIWFEVDEFTGEAIDPDNGLLNPPGDCPALGSEFCARALTYPGEVTFVGGKYHIATGVDITEDFDDQRMKN
ncbi:MAG TPA: hypothetical protein VFO70_10965 [Chitinophagaceae bacterium]|nr:hypothetical protein [Chitinophagaceae bacterium]